MKMTEQEAAEIMRETSKCLDEINVKLNRILEEYQQFKAIGTVEEFKTLKEKTAPKKPIEHNFYDEPHHCLCPSCGNIVDDKPNYCEECGQHLDWE